MSPLRWLSVCCFVVCGWCAGDSFHQQAQAHLEALRKTLKLLETLHQQISFRRSDLNLLCRKLIQDGQLPPETVSLQTLEPFPSLTLEERTRFSECFSGLGRLEAEQECRRLELYQAQFQAALQEGEAAAVLITNTSLPDMSGFELARYVRRQFPCLRVIFLTDTPNLAEAQQAVRCGAYDYLPKSDGIDALRSAMIRVSEELHTESREEAYLRGQQNWDECISRLLKLLLALKPGIDEDHWQMYSKVKPLLSDAPLRMEALLVRSLMEELRAEICRRDEALAAQLRSNMMAAPLGMLTSAQGTAAYMDAIWALLSEKGYITQEDALKSDPIGRACVYMQSHLSEKLTVQELAEYVHISPRHFIRKFQTEMNEKFTDYLAHIRVQAAIQMLEAGRDVKSIPEAVGYRDEKSLYSVFRRFAGCSMREYQQKLNLSQRKEKQP